MTLTISDQKVILINTFVANAFTVNVDFELATLVVAWLADKVLMNHVALDITKDGTRLAIETTLPLNYPDHAESVKEILDTCFKFKEIFQMIPSLLASGELEQNMKALNTKVAEINKKTSEVFVQELDPDYTELRALLFKVTGTEPITEEISLIA